MPIKKGGMVTYHSQGNGWSKWQNVLTTSIRKLCFCRVFLWENAQTVWGSGIKPPIQCQGKKQISMPLLTMIRFYVKMDFNNCDNTVTIYDNIIS